MKQGVCFVGNRDTSTIIQTTSQKTGFIAIERRAEAEAPCYAEALTGKRLGPGRPFIKVRARFSSRIIDCFLV